MVKCSCSDSQSSFGDVVHVFMSSFSEAADINITASLTHASVVSSKKTASAAYINTETGRSHI